MDTTVNQACIVCGNQGSNLLFDCKDHFISQKNFKVVCCGSCGFVFTSNPPSKEEIGVYYKSEAYISHSNTQKGLVNKLYHIVRNLMLRKKWKLISKLTPGKDLLDIGCGTGYFPGFMKTKGYSCQGMEIDEDARKFASTQFGINVSSPDTLLDQDLTSKFDIITLWHVLEHLYDTEKYMQWIFNSLKQDGKLIIAIPNCSSFDAAKYGKYWAAYDVPRHLWHFTPQTFEHFIGKYNFKLIKIKRLPFDAFYNSLMSARYAGKRISLIHGFVIGMLSNTISFFNLNRTSSVIYILKK